jgi:EAL and modified HD-GYP domain-containing signal transduction protein
LAARVKIACARPITREPMHSYVARQPIFDRRLGTFGYELLFRRAGPNDAQAEDADAATATTLLTIMADIGLDSLVGSRLAFVNVTRRFLLDGHAALLPPDRVVLELLDDLPADGDVVAAARNLAATGRVLALGNFSFRPDNEPLLEHVRIVKLDVGALTPRELKEHVERLAGRGKQLLAEKVGTHEEHARCLKLGFDFFQGYFFCQPTTHRGRTIPSNRLSRLKLLARLQDPEVDRDELAAIIGVDVGLSYRVLRYVNSAASGLRRRIDSVTEALVFLGHRRLRSIATVIVLAESRDQPHELLVTALVRARTCEQLAPVAGVEASAAFTAGLFSVVEALMDMPMQVVLEQLPFSADFNAALLEGAGALGALLGRVRDYERGELEAAPEDVEALARAYVDALEWARNGPATLALT